MKKAHSYLFIAFLFSITGYSQKTNYSKETEARIKAVENSLASWVETQDMTGWSLEDRMKYYKVNGVSIAVIKDYKIEWAKGYGFADVTEKRMVDAKTLFQAASISKSVNAIAVLKLSQDKKLDLYVDINNYLKSWKFPYDSIAKNKKITTANLLSHTAGLSVHGFRGYMVNETLPSLIQILNGEKPANSDAVRSEFEPSLRFQYSGGGTTVSQLLITDITGQRYEQYMWENILEPIGMLDSSFAQPQPASMAAGLATGYSIDGSQKEGKYNIYPEQAAAGLWTNPTDIARFVIEIQLSYSGKSNKVLSRDMIRTTLTPVPEGQAALGTFVIDKDGEKYFQHSGSNEGFMSHYYGSLEGGNGVVVMVNSDNGGVMREVVNSVAKVYNWKNFYKPVPKTVVNIPEAVMKEYAGYYEADGQGMNIVMRENSLWMVGPYGERRMYFTSDEDFFMHENMNSPKFVRATTGEVKGIQFNENYFIGKVR